ncbi:radical SAM protein [bacterium]|nr:radical SAM protein [candidate division CSSED10-310 bacterium]
MISIPTLYNFLTDLHAIVPRALGNGYALPPLRVGCVLTHRCNLRCSMCFVWKRGTDNLRQNELTTVEWMEIFNQIPGFSIITFTGGEPLIRKDLPRLLQTACRTHRVHLVTNGTLFTDDLIEQAVDLAPSRLSGKGLLSVGISLEGSADIHNTMVGVPNAFQKTTEAIRRLAQTKRERRQKYPLLDLKIVICRENLHSLTELYDLADDLGMDIISYQQCSTQESSYGIDDADPEALKRLPPPVDTVDRTELTGVLTELKSKARKGRTALRFNPDMPFETFADRYENRFPLKDFTCYAAWSIMHVGPYGTVYPCFSLPMGNLKGERLGRIWNGDRYRAFRRRLKSSRIFPGCVGCCVMKKKSTF